jgi:hypothetical protein
LNRWIPCKRREFIKKLIKLNFQGPYNGGNHAFMIYHGNRLTIPSNDEYSVSQIKMILKQIEKIIERKIEITEWNNL